MLARLLPILALLVLCVLGYYLWSQGAIQKIVRPTVAVVETDRQLIEGQRLRQGFISVREISISRVQPGVVTFPSGTTTDEIETALSGQAISRNVPAGTFLTSAMLGEQARLVVLRATDNVRAGDNLTLDNVEATELDNAPPGGVIVFDTAEEGVLYLNQAYDLTASQDIFAGQILTISDTAGDSERVFVIQAARDYARSERLSIDGLEAAEISSRDIPAGAITFRTRGATDVFITSASRYQLSRDLDFGDTLTADAITNEGVSSSDAAPGELPRTLSELTSYIRAYPDRAMFLNDENLIGRSVDPGESIDIWAEESRTDGAFGEIRMRRVADGVLVREAVDNTRDPSEAQRRASGEAGAAEPDAGDTEEEEKTRPGTQFLWVALDPEVKRQFDAARRDQGVSFAIRDDARLVDVLGNGAACLDDRCQVNRTASEDLGDIMAQIATEDGAGPGQAEEMQAPLTVMDGVSPQLEERLRANGYETFEQIAAWRDGEMPAITIKLDISNNLAVYIRQQARILAESATEAAQSLGFEEAPTE